MDSKKKKKKRRDQEGFGQRVYTSFLVTQKINFVRRYYLDNNVSKWIHFVIIMFKVNKYSHGS